MKVKQMFVFTVFMAFAVLFNFGCDKNQNPVSSDNKAPGQVSMMSKYSSSSAANLNKSGSVQAVDSIEITGVRFVLKDVKLEGIEKEHEEDDKSGINKIDDLDEENFRTGPFVLSLNLTGSLQQVTVSDIPLGTYKEVKFKIHRIQQSDLDSLTSSEQQQFADFIADGGYSIIIEGNKFSNDTATPFTFKSSLNAVMEIEFSPVLIVDSNNPNPNLTLEINSGNWFTSFNGNLLDPDDQSNKSTIEKNIKKSVHVYEDSDRDGHEDDD